MQIGNIPANALPVAEPRVDKKAKDAQRGADDAAAVKKVAREFEAMFVSMMMKSMRETVGKDTLTGGGRGEETFRSLLDQEYANAAVAGGGIGLARSIERELMRDQGVPAPDKGVTDAD